MELTDFQILYWHWILIGLLLVMAELFAPMFVTLWLGAAAIITGLLLLLINLNFSSQLVVWALLSLSFLLLWHKYVSPRLTDQTMAGLSREAIVGQVGMVTFYNHNESRGNLKFPAPIVGNDEWEFIYKSGQDQPDLHNGDKVLVVDISGNSLIVKPQS